jgi:anti-sigma factor RsiW
MSAIPVNENELHAYVDGALTAARRAEVEAHLATHADDAARVATWSAQKQALRALCNPVLEEPLPERLLAAAAPATGRRGGFLSRWSLERIAATLFVAVLGGVAGWLGHARYQPAPLAVQAVPLPRQAAVAHVVFSPDVRRPVEVRAEQEDQLVTWLSKRLGTPVRPPKLGALGYELIGGRLLPGNSGPVAQFMYHDASGQRLTLYISTENATHRDTAFRFAQEGQVNVFYWVDGTFGYALSAGIAKGELAKVATAVYDQLEPASPQSPSKP